MLRCYDIVFFTKLEEWHVHGHAIGGFVLADDETSVMVAVWEHDCILIAIAAKKNRLRVVPNRTRGMLQALNVATFLPTLQCVIESGHW